jgi:hypothetical protein
MKLVYVNSFDIQGYAELVSEKCGKHVRMLNDDNVLYFQDKEVLPLPQYDCVVTKEHANLDYAFRYSGALLSSILFLYDVKQTDDVYRYLMTRLQRPPYSITIMPTGGI